MVSPWVLPVLLLVVVVAALLGWVRGRRRTHRTRATPVANTDYLQEVPAYRRRMSVLRTGLAVAAGFLLLTAVAAATLAARPVDRDTRSEVLATRDIVLCLDVSGSMIELDTQIVQKFDQLVESFDGERIALNVWNTTSRTVFPLTDDYSLVQEELDAAAEALDFPLDSWIYDQADLERLERFLAGTVSSESDSSSLVGDGLATCVLAFDEQGGERSRSIILATDNIVLGSPVYELTEAADLAAERDISVHGLYAVLEEYADPQAQAEFEEVITEHGGLYYAADDPAAVDGIIEDIAEQQAVELDAEPELVVTDRPDSVLPYLVIGLTGMLALLWRLRA